MRRLSAGHLLPRTAAFQAGKDRTASQALLPRGADHWHGNALSLPQQGAGGILHQPQRKDHLGRLSVGHPPRDGHRQLHDRGRNCRQHHCRRAKAAAVLQADDLQRGHAQGLSAPRAGAPRLSDKRDHAGARNRHARIPLQKQLRARYPGKVPRNHDHRAECQQPQHQSCAR